jgi:hypothetical protein
VAVWARARPHISSRPARHPLSALDPRDLRAEGKSEKLMPPGGRHEDMSLWTPEEDRLLSDLVDVRAQPHLVPTSWDALFVARPSAFALAHHILLSFRRRPWGKSGHASPSPWPAPESSGQPRCAAIAGCAWSEGSISQSKAYPRTGAAYVARLNVAISAQGRQALRRVRQHLSKPWRTPPCLRRRGK